MDFSIMACPIRSFQSIMQCAISAAESLPHGDLFVAFKSTMSLFEKLVDLMQNQRQADLKFISSSAGGNSFLTTSGISAKPEMNSLQFLVSSSSPNFTQSISSPSNGSNNMLHADSLSFPSLVNGISTNSLLNNVSSVASETLAALNSLVNNTSVPNNEPIVSNAETFSQPPSSSDNGNAVSPTPHESLSSSNQMRASPVVGGGKRGRKWSDASLHSIRRRGVNSDELNRLLDSCEIDNTTSTTNTNTSQLLGTSNPDHHINSNSTALTSASDEFLLLNQHNNNGTTTTTNSNATGTGGRKNYRCKFCGKMYDIKSSIRYHIRIIHLKMHLRQDEMRCKVCSRVFTCVTAAQKHQSRCCTKYSSAGSNTTTNTNTVSNIALPPAASTSVSES